MNEKPLGIFAAEFVRWNNALPDRDMPIWQRWGDVLTHIPEARKRGVAGVYDDVYASAMLSKGAIDPEFPWTTAKLLYGGIELARLQRAFFEQCLHAKIGQAHAAKYRANAAYAWGRKMEDKFMVSLPAGFSADDTFLPEIMLPVAQHDWLH